MPFKRLNYLIIFTHVWACSSEPKADSVGQRTAINECENSNLVHAEVGVRNRGSSPVVLPGTSFDRVVSCDLDTHWGRGESTTCASACANARTAAVTVSGIDLGRVASRTVVAALTDGEFDAVIKRHEQEVSNLPVTDATGPGPIGRAAASFAQACAAAELFETTTCYVDRACPDDKPSAVTVLSGVEPATALSTVTSKSVREGVEPVADVVFIAKKEGGDGAEVEGVVHIACNAYSDRTTDGHFLQSPCPGACLQSAELAARNRESVIVGATKLQLAKELTALGAVLSAPAQDLLALRAVALCFDRPERYIDVGCQIEPVCDRKDDPRMVDPWVKLYGKYPIRRLPWVTKK